MSKTRKWYTRALYLVFALALVAGLTIVPAVGASPDVSNVKVELSDYLSGATDVTYYVYFTPGVELAKNTDTITVFFPVGTLDVTSDDARVDRDADGVLYGTTDVSTKSIAGHRFTVTTPVKLAAGTEVRVEIDGITNPTITPSTKAYTLKVYTSQETTQVESGAYTIGPKSVGSVTFNPADSKTAAVGTAGLADEFLVTFTTTTALTEDWDTISVVFPDEVTVPSSIAASKVCVDEAGASGTWTPLEQDPTISGQTVTLLVPSISGQDIGAEAVEVWFNSTANIKNPTLATDTNNATAHKGKYVGRVYTSQDAGVQRVDFAQKINAVQPPSALAFKSTCPTSVAVSTASATFTVYSNDQYGNHSDVTTNVDVNLSSSSSTGSFYCDDDGDGDLDTWDSTSPNTMIQDSDGSDVSAIFQYKDTAVGTATITASYGSWTVATWDIDVGAKAVELWDGDVLIGTYGTIAAAEADAGTYNTIKVGPGTYGFSATLIIDVAHLTIESTDGAANTIIDASALTSGGFDGAGILIDVDAAGVTVDGFTIKDAGACGIYCRGDNAIIQNNVVTFKALTGGIDVAEMATVVTVSGNELNEYAVMIVHGSDCTLSGNTFGSVLWFWPGSGYTLEGVTISDNIFPANADYGAIDLRSHAVASIINDSLIEGNTISNRKYGIWIGSENPSDLTVTKLIITGNDITGNTRDGIKIESWPTTLADRGRIMFNNISGNGGTSYYGVENTTSNDVAADHNWWGDASGPTVSGNPGGTGDKITSDVTYGPWLGASVSAADYKASVSSLDAQSTVGVKVSSSDTATNIGVAHYTSNPQETPEFTPLDFFDVYALADTWTGDVVTIKLYADGVTSTSKAYFWSEGEDEWMECYEQGAASGYVWAKVRPYDSIYPERVPVLTDLTGLPFAISGEEVPVETIEDQLADIEDELQMVYYFDNATKAWSYYWPTVGGDLDVLVSDSPYWINVDADCTIDSISLYAGWNLVVW